jgi:hypothetical protein
VLLLTFIAAAATPKGEGGDSGGKAIQAKPVVLTFFLNVVATRKMSY